MAYIVHRFLRSETNNINLLTITVVFFAFLFPAHDAITILAVIWGFGLTIIFSNVMYNTPRDGILWKLLTLVLGVVVVVLIWKGLKLILPYNASGRFVRYAVLGFWIAYLPLLVGKRTK